MLGQTKLAEMLGNSIKRTLEKDVESLNLDFVTFCHGYSGILLIVNLLKQNLSFQGCDRFEKAVVKKIVNAYSYEAKYCFKDYDYEYLAGELSEDLKSFDKIGFLSGTTGVMLALLGYCADFDVCWNKLFMG